MIKLITGKKGTGKTKILIDTINDAVKTTNGCLVCIEKGSALSNNINFRVRKCDTEYFGIDTYNSFYGFVAGLMAGNYDIKEIYVDGIFKIAGRELDEFGTMLQNLAKLTGDDVTVVFTVSADVSELPSSVTAFVD
jgi:hypothetical protein